MALTKNTLHLFLTLLALSHLFSQVLGVPTSGGRKLLHERLDVSKSLNNKLIKQGIMGEEAVQEDEFMMNGRMVLQTNDYPGTGANPHHTPPKVSPPS